MTPGPTNMLLSAEDEHRASLDWLQVRHVNPAICWATGGSLTVGQVPPVEDAGRPLAGQHAALETRWQ